MLRDTLLQLTEEIKKFESIKDELFEKCVEERLEKSLETYTKLINSTYNNLLTMPTEDMVKKIEKE